MKIQILYIVTILLSLSCSSKRNNPVPIPPPAKVALSTPIQNAVCTTGTIVSDTQSNITFTWTAAGNTDDYELVIKNLLTSDSTMQATANTQEMVSLSRNTPFSWYILSKSNQTSTVTKSDIWKFYNSGPGTVTYAPFPAEITAPTFAQAVTASTVNLNWTGSVISPDVIVNYDVYFGNTKAPALLKSAVTNNFVNGVSVSANNTYYWKVITRDSNGDTSDSGLYQFSVN
jgi:hypothetical protein